MNKSCEKPTRTVMLKGDSLIVSLKDCKRCDTCKRAEDDILITDVIESEGMMKSAYGRWLATREKFIKEVITLN